MHYFLSGLWRTCVQPIHNGALALQPRSFRAWGVRVFIFDRLPLSQDESPGLVCVRNKHKCKPQGCSRPCLAPQIFTFVSKNLHCNWLQQRSDPPRNDCAPTDYRRLSIRHRAEPVMRQKWIRTRYVNVNYFCWWHFKSRLYYLSIGLPRIFVTASMLE
jgi:hypothetical protein